jgi:hypothetical protein
MATIRECVATLTKNADLKSFFAQCHNVAEEFKALKKAYHKLVLVVHPDKGGSKEEFCKVRASFEVLRDLYNNNAVTSFEVEAGRGTPGFGEVKQRMRSGPVPSWAFYEDAAKDEIPVYKVELGEYFVSCSQHRFFICSLCLSHKAHDRSTFVNVSHH